MLVPVHLYGRSFAPASKCCLATSASVAGKTATFLRTCRCQSLLPFGRNRDRHSTIEIRRIAMPVIVVTGASAGIGLAIADRFARAGWQVVVIARQAERLSNAVEQLKRSGNRVIGMAGDVSDPEFVEQAGRDVVSAFGGIDVWVNNAMST
ncbi:SDR family NAD(P)-dependent oxidoreductase, partial [uncultured Brevundimonas sp.]|uniref:SDR family NAD(P)-dependent oxidoreductase n=1 Tax=uncultured Brevundimonas sp. TaxID=213418 RepID=UPI0025FC9C92